MTDLLKFLIGGAATSLLAWGTHAVNGERIVGKLNDKASAALTASGIEGVTVDDMTKRSPLSRVAVLSGEVDDAARSKAKDAVGAVRGLSAVRWAGEGDVSEGETAEPAAVSACQSGVDQAIADQSINFRSGSAYLSPASLRAIDAVAAQIKKCGDGGKNLSIAVGGHTDSTGSAEINTSMSQARADAVAAALAQRGIAKSQITAKGYGSAKPKIDGDGANAANRRIEFTVTGGAGAAARPEGE